MKKPLLIGTTVLALALSATSIYAQVVAGTSIVDKMKAVAHTFTLSTELNAGQTGLTSEPVKGKKTGNILTAGEWNRMLELVSEGGIGGGSGWVNVSLTDTADYDTACLYKVELQTSDADNISYMNGPISTRIGNNISPKYLGLGFTAGSGIVDAVWGVPSTAKNSFGYRNKTGTYTVASNVTILRIQKSCGVVVDNGGSSGWVNVPLTDTNPFDQQCMYRFVTGGQTYYAETVHENRLYWVYNMYFDKASKSNLVGGIAPYNVATKIEKLCDGGGSGGTSNITWANFDGRGGVAMKGSNGITSIVRESAGNYRVTFATPRPDADYGIICTSGPSPSYLCFPHEKSPTSFLIKTSNPTNNVDAPFVSLLVTPFDAGVSSGAVSVYTKCTNAQSADSTNIPCYAASRGTGAGTDQYRVMSCTINDGVRTYTAASILNFNNLVANKWAISVNGGTIECVDGSILVAKIQ